MKIRNIIILIFILLLAAFLRFYRLPEMAPFDFDQEWAANFAYRVIHEYPIQLIGQGLSVEGLFMGPIGFYLLTPFYFLTNLYPLGGSIGAAFFGLIIIASYFFVGKALIGPKAGLVAAFLRAVSISEIMGDLNPAPLTISEILVLWLWWAFYRYWHGDKRVLPFIGLILGLFTSMHPVHFPFYLIFPIFILLKRSSPGFKNLLLTGVSFLVAFSPLLLFEILHNFLEAKVLISLFIQPTSEIRDWGRFSHWLNYNLQEIPRVLAIKSTYNEFFGLFILLIIAVLVWKKVSFWKDRFHSLNLLLVVFAFLLYYGVFLPKNVTEYYFLAVKILIFLYIGATLSLLLKKNYTAPILAIILIYIGVVNFKSLQAEWNNPSKIALYYKDFIVQEIVKRQPQNQDFYVSYINEPGWNFGFNYLFKYYGRIPQTKEAKPPVYTIVIPKYLSEESIDISSSNVGLILPDSK